VSGNRDEEIFDEPFRFDVGRDPNKHLSFGYGVHFCLGAALARLEIEVVFGRLASRFGTIELAGETPYRDTLTLRGPVQVPITVDPTRRASGAPVSAVPATAPVDVAPATDNTVLPLRPADGDDLDWRNRYRQQVESAAGTSADHAEVAALLGRIGFFAGCSEEELQSLASTAFPIAFSPGELICEAGAESLECYVVAEGFASIEVYGKEIATVGPDDVVGERGPVLDAPRSATVVATTHVNTYAISRDRLQRLIADSPRARAGIEADMANRYRHYQR
jgi:hypothetical protein